MEGIHYDSTMFFIVEAPGPKIIKKFVCNLKMSVIINSLFPRQAFPA
jgi:hypothetical protein